MDDLRTDLRSDADCLLAAAAGERQAFDTIARRYQPRLVRFAARSLTYADAADAVQDALVKAFLNAARYDPRQSATTWLFTLTRRTIIDRLRTIHRARAAKSLPESLAPSPTGDVERRDTHGRLWAIAAAQLNPDQTQALWLHYVEDLGTRDVARVMGRSWVWVKTALHRGRKTLAPHVRHLHDGPAAIDRPRRMNEVTV